MCQPHSKNYLTIGLDLMPEVCIQLLTKDPVLANQSQLSTSIIEESSQSSKMNILSPSSRFFKEYFSQEENSQEFEKVMNQNKFKKLLKTKSTYLDALLVKMHLEKNNSLQ